MKTKFTRDEALALLKEHNKEHFHIQHGITVGKVMRYYAEEHGYGDDADFWEICGILHDVDFEEYPEEHCKKAPEILEAAGAEPELIHAVCSHGYGICSDVEPEHEMEKFLFASDELTGLITATALMRPEKMKGISVKSIKKKWKDKSFAAGVNREVITKGTEMLGMETQDVIQLAIDGMTKIAPEIGLWPEEA